MSASNMQMAQLLQAMKQKQQATQQSTGVGPADAGTTNLFGGLDQANNYNDIFTSALDSGSTKVGKPNVVSGSPNCG